VAYCRTGKRPNDIPSTPNVSYSKDWSGWGDWLGTDFVHHSRRRLLPFTKARTFSRSLGLKSHLEWLAYCKSGKKPADIPIKPDRVYANEGWAGVDDWLGTGKYRGAWRPFKKARAFARRLGLKSGNEWYEYSKSRKKPVDIPANPNTVYAQSGWSSMGDWLGTGRIADQLREWRPFKKARAYVRGLGLKSYTEWRKYCKSGKKPADIPTVPSRVYAKAGWAGLGDWLGTDTISFRQRKYRPFKKARAFAHKLKLKSQSEWIAYKNSGKKPDDIPAKPDNTYLGKGWAGYGDWLGTGTIAPRLRKYRSFKTARVFARSLGLRSLAKWWEYCKSGEKPADIPASPQSIYAKEGWTGWGDWLGTGRLRGIGWRGIGWRTFKKARSFVRRLGLKSGREWYDYSKSGKKPADIPADPRRTYAKTGWAGDADWLGYA
jgi:hypothetical protein